MKKLLKSTAFWVIITLVVIIGIICSIYGAIGLLYLLSGFMMLLFLGTIVLGLIALTAVPSPDDIDPL